MPPREQRTRLWTEEAILTLVRQPIKRLINRALTGSGIGGPPVDHGGLNGLLDDDHTQYLRDTTGTGGDAINVTARVINFDPDKPATATPVRTDELAFQDIGVGVRKTTLGALADLADLATIGGAPNDAQYLTLALDGDLSAERVLVPGDGLVAVDGGANGNFDLAVRLVGDPSGLAFDGGGGLQVLIGDGLQFNVNTIEMNLGAGLQFSGPAEVEINLVTGSGLSIILGGGADELGLALGTLADFTAALDRTTDEIAVRDATDFTTRRLTVREINAVEHLLTNIVDATAITSTAETDVDQTATIPADSLAVGDRIVSRISGVYSTGFSGGAMQWRIRLDDGSSDVLLFDFTSETYGAGTLTNRPFILEADSVVRSIGATGTINTTYTLHLHMSSTDGLHRMPGTSPTVLATVDTTVVNTLKWTADWSSSGNSVTGHLVSFIKYKG